MKQGLAVLVCALVMAGTSSASAESTSFGYPIYAAELSGGATINSGSLLLPKEGDPGFMLSVVLPKDYSNQTPVAISFLLGTTTGGKTCTAVIRPIQMIRARAGRQPEFDGGITPADGDRSTEFAGPRLVKEVFNMQPTANFPGQRKGDAMLMYFVRNTGDVLDTCPDALRLYAIDLEYLVHPAR